MPPPRAASADPPAQRAPEDAITAPAEIAAAIEQFLAAHPDATLLESGKRLFDLRETRYAVSTEHGRCVLQLWSADRHLVRTVVGATEKRGNLRLGTTRLGQAKTGSLELTAQPERRTPTTRDRGRERYLRLLERVLQREFHGWTTDGFRTAMDLERSFGPAYARGTLVRGQQAWAVIGVSAEESGAIIDGVLTLGILWLELCRERAAGRRLFTGLRVIVPHGAAATTQSRMAWLNKAAAEWELYELDEASEQLTAADPADTGNLSLRLIHHPDNTAALERFAPAIAAVQALVPAGEWERVEVFVRSTAEVAFLVHGLEFARTRMEPAPNSFAHLLVTTVGSGPDETPLTPATLDALRARTEKLLVRRRALPFAPNFARRTEHPRRRIGVQQHDAAHTRLRATQPPALRTRARSHAQDPLFRAAPERWLESVLRRELGKLTRGLAAQPVEAPPLLDRRRELADQQRDDDNLGNRADTPASLRKAEQLIARFDPRFVYSQVSAIAGTSDRGRIDLLGLTTDGRIAVIELKAEEDLHFALQGLDYWIRVRAQHLAPPDHASGLGEFKRHGYFTSAELAPLPPRLFLVAPALRIHPATEAVLRYLAPEVEWQMIALDERWREQVRVVWRRSAK